MTRRGGCPRCCAYLFFRRTFSTLFPRHTGVISNKSGIFCLFMSLFGPTLSFVLVATSSTLRWRKVNLVVLSNSLHPRFWPLQQASLILKGKEKNSGPSYRNLRPVCSLGQKDYISFCLFFYVAAKSVWCELLGPELWSMKKKKVKVFRSARNRGKKWWGCWTVLSTLQPRHKPGLKAIQLADDYRVCVWKDKGFFFPRVELIFFLLNQLL